MLQPKAIFSQILKRFPPCEFSVAYGSGVFQQLGYTAHNNKATAKEQPMLDMILGVRDSREWHTENMHMNNKDYAWPLSWCPGSWVGSIQEAGGAHMLYHPYIDVSAITGNNQLLKYGVISIRHLEEDLAYWDTLFCAGRLHKPTAILNSTPELDQLMQQNMRSALYTALLQLPSHFSERDVYLQITGLSYAGDPRFLIGAESFNKVSNIVDANLAGFQLLYRPLLSEIEWLTRADEGDESAVWAYTRTATAAHIVNTVDSLPAHFRRVLSASSHEIADLVVTKRSHAEVQAVVHKGLSKIVRGAAGLQHAKGLLSAGVGNSVYYIMAKWSKGRQSRSQPSHAAASPTVGVTSTADKSASSASSTSPLSSASSSSTTTPSSPSRSFSTFPPKRYFSAFSNGRSRPAGIRRFSSMTLSGRICSSKSPTSHHVRWCSTPASPQGSQPKPEVDHVKLANDQPWRRPVPGRGSRVVQSMARRLAIAGVSPNTISVLSAGFGLAAGLSFAATGFSCSPGPTAALWFTGVCCSQFRLLCNLLDGMVAAEIKSRGRFQNPLGHVYNELPDRMSDAAMLLGLGYAAHSSPILGSLATVGALLTAYVRSLGGETGAGQNFGGLMAKPIRAFVVSLCGVSCSISNLTLMFPSISNVSLDVLMYTPQCTLVIILLGTIQTIVKRLEQIQTKLSQTI